MIQSYYAVLHDGGNKTKMAEKGQSWKTTAHVINLRGKTGDDKAKP